MVLCNHDNSVHNTMEITDTAFHVFGTVDWGTEPVTLVLETNVVLYYI